MDQLPDVVLEHIFGFCDGPVLLRFAFTTCTRFKNIVLNSTPLMKKVPANISMSPISKQPHTNNQALLRSPKLYQLLVEGEVEFYLFKDFVSNIKSLHFDR